MGDHRSESADSRRPAAQGGGVDTRTIPEDRVVGRAFVVVWPISHFSVLTRPGGFAEAGLAGGSSGPFEVGAESVAALALVLPLAVADRGHVRFRRWTRSRDRTDRPV